MATALTLSFSPSGREGIEAIDADEAAVVTGGRVADMIPPVSTPIIASGARMRVTRSSEEPFEHNCP